MKFVPNPTGAATWTSPFCSLNKGCHGLGLSVDDTICEECGQGQLTDVTSDHMGIRDRLVVLCLSCAKTYQEIWALSQVVGV